MHFKFYLLLYTHLFFIHYSNAFNITTILNQYPSFSIFNRYLSETNVSSEINSRQTITVLAVLNDDVLRLSGKQHQNDKLDDLMRVHVVLDYFDVEKLHDLQNGTTQMTTLFQTTGRAFGQQGFLKATVSKTGNVVIGSMTSGVPVGAILVNSVFAEPFNISVLHISTEIVPVGMNFPSISRVDAPPPSPKTSKTPVSPTRCRHKVSPSPNPHGESPPEGAPAPRAPSGSSADASASAESQPLLAPKLVPLPSHSRSPTPSPNPPPAAKSPPKGAPASTKSPPEGAPPGAPSGGSASAPSSTKLPPAGAPTGAPSGGSANTPTSTKSPPEDAASSGSYADTPKSPPKSIETPPRSPPQLADTPAEPPTKPADTPQSDSGSSNSSLVVITIVLSCINLIMQT